MTKVLPPCPRCGCPLKVDRRKRYAFCPMDHFAMRLVVSPHTRFLARGATAEDVLSRQGDTATWSRLKKGG